MKTEADNASAWACFLACSLDFHSTAPMRPRRSLRSVPAARLAGGNMLPPSIVLARTPPLLRTGHRITRAHRSHAPRAAVLAELGLQFLERPFSPWRKQIRELLLALPQLISRCVRRVWNRIYMLLIDAVRSLRNSLVDQIVERLHEEVPHLTARRFSALPSHQPRLSCAGIFSCHGSASLRFPFCTIFDGKCWLTSPAPYQTPPS